MKRIISVMLILLVLGLILCGCSKSKEPEKPVTEDVMTTSEETFPSYDEKDIQAIIDKYLKQYNAKYYYVDEYVNFKCFIVTGDSIVSLNAIPGAEHIEIIPFTSIAKIDETVLMGTTIVTVHDRNNEQDSICLPSDKAIDMLSHIDYN